VALVAGAALAQSGEGYELSWSTVDGEGTTFSTGEGLSLGGTTDQPDTGLPEGGAYTPWGMDKGLSPRTGLSPWMMA